MLRQAVPTGKQPCQARHLHPVAAAGRKKKLQTRTQKQDQHEAQTPALAGPLYQHTAPLHCCCCCCHAILQLQHQLQRCKGRRPIWGAAKEVCNFAHLWPLSLACSTAPRHELSFSQSVSVRYKETPRGPANPMLTPGPNPCPAFETQGATNLPQVSPTTCSTQAELASNMYKA